MVEGDPAVVDAVEPELRAAVLDRHAGQHGAVRVAQRDEQGVDAARLAADHELREDRRQPPVARRVADVVLARARRRACGRRTPPWRRRRSRSSRAPARSSRGRSRSSRSSRAARAARSPSGARSWWRIVPRCSTAPPNSPNWTPHLTSRLRSPNASVSKPAIEPRDVAERRRTRPGSPSRSRRSSPAPPPRPSTCARYASRGRSVDGRVAGLGEPVADHRRGSSASGPSSSVGGGRAGAAHASRLVAGRRVRRPRART